MAQFACRYMNASNQIVSEVITADDQNELNSILRERGYRVIKIEEVNKKSVWNMDIGPSHMQKKSVTLFCRQMATMLTSGIPMAKCFDIVGSQSDDKIMKQRMTDLTNDVMAGSTLSAAMEKYPDDFPGMLTEMIKVGEVTGDLDGVLNRMADQYEKSEKINQKVKGALTYPIVVMIVAIVACIFMIIKVVPGFQDVFASLDSELPALTQALLDMSDFLTTKWYVVILVAPVIVILLIRVFKIPQVRSFFDKLKLSLSLIRQPMLKLTASRFARTLHTLISSGVPIVQALEYTKKSVANLYVEEEIDKIALGIRQGKSLSGQMADSPVFPSLLVSMLSVGENSGDLEGMLSKSADYFDDETAATIEQLTTILEPVMIVVVGLMVGVMVIALYAPMFESITAIQNGV